MNGSCQLPAFFEGQFAVAQGVGNGGRNFWQTFEQGGDPGGGEGVYFRFGILLVEYFDQGVSEQGVTDPGGGDDENFHVVRIQPG